MFFNNVILTAAYNIIKYILRIIFDPYNFVPQTVIF